MNLGGTNNNFKIPAVKTEVTYNIERYVIFFYIESFPGTETVSSIQVYYNSSKIYEQFVNQHIKPFTVKVCNTKNKPREISDNEDEKIFAAERVNSENVVNYDRIE